MAPTPPHTPFYSFSATVSRRRRSATPRPAGCRQPRKRLATVARGRWSHPIALVLAACCAVSLTLLTACAKDAPPTEVTGTLPTQFMAGTPTSADATPTASALPSLSPELQAQRATALAEPKPSKPEAVSQNTEEGAINAVNYFFALYRYAFITGDTADLAAMSEDACVFCKSTIDDATKLHQGGGWANPWDQENVRIEYIPAGQGKEYSGARITLKTGPTSSVNQNGELKESDAQEEVKFLLKIRYYDGMWHIGGVSAE